MEIDRKTVRAVMKEMGRKGGKKAAGKGAQVAASNMTPEQRSERARAAAEARWGPKKSGKAKKKAG